MINTIIYSEPNHPNPSVIVKQVLSSSKTLTFQNTWYDKYPWIHFSAEVKGVLCFYCSKYFKGKKPCIATKVEQCFISTGFTNWKKALEKFKIHASSAGHRLAMTTVAHEHNSISLQLQNASAKTHKENRSNLLKIIGAVKYLARQGMAFRGHEEAEGNFQQLLQYKASNDPDFANWLERKRNVYTSWAYKMN